MILTLDMKEFMQKVGRGDYSEVGKSAAANAKEMNQTLKEITTLSLFAGKNQTLALMEQSFQTGDGNTQCGGEDIHEDVN